MTNTIACPHCGKQVEISTALRHQIEEQFKESLENKHKLDLEEAKKKIEEITLSRAKEQFETLVKDAKEEAKEQQERNKELNEQLLDLNKQFRALRLEDEKRKVEMEKRLIEEQEKIRAEARKTAEESQHNKILEYEKKLQDAVKTNQELQRKLEQGSQQTQGEVLELELEQLLKTEFPLDEIKPVPKGIRGADVLQLVRDRNSRSCGTIVWESKNAQWKPSWIGKLKEDKRAVNAEVAVLVSINVPSDITNFTYRDGVWVTNRASLIGLAMALRMNLIHVAWTKNSLVGKNEKMESLYRYLSGTEFRHRIEAIIEAFSTMQAELENEKRWFASKWSRQEKQIRSVIDHTYGMHGELQGIMGNVLPEVKSLNTGTTDEK